MSELRLYTDGSCASPGAVGGWAWVLVNDQPIARGSGVTPGSSTHNAAELTAAIEGLTHLVASGVHTVEVCPDSRYLVGGMSANDESGWAHAAAARGWRTGRGKPLANRDLWERLLELERHLAISWRRVPGHRPMKDTSDDARYNREVDALAGEARRGS
jgi:ribonuclease HI